MKNPKEKEGRKRRGRGRTEGRRRKGREGKGIQDKGKILGRYMRKGYREKSWGGGKDTGKGEKSGEAQEKRV